MNGIDIVSSPRRRDNVEMPATPAGIVTIN
jgi:hypothetical protein